MGCDVYLERLAFRPGCGHSWTVTEYPVQRDPFAPLLPYVGQQTDRWVERWAVITSEVTRRAGLMGLDSAVRSVRDDLDAGRL